MKMWLHLPVLVPSAFPLVWRCGGKLEVCSRKNGGKSFTATKGGGRVAHGKQASHFAIRYAVSQFCHYQRSVTAVLENEVFCSARVFCVYSLVDCAIAKMAFKQKHNLYPCHT